MTKNKVFTPEEIKEVEELIKTIPRDELLEKYDISTTILCE